MFLKHTRYRLDTFATGYLRPTNAPPAQVLMHHRFGKHFYVYQRAHGLFTSIFQRFMQLFNGGDAIAFTAISFSDASEIDRDKPAFLTTALLLMENETR
ncbi:Uncharacterised protein [Salmonella enterica subsp. enterica]|uniref:Uncharacterized protein n=1 Tax=Salmonella enterica I TaxID=59201 RepID=A0A379X1B0_SALET|nr:Uncharacterised protein [Salmonella enterica subsp. enterica]